MNILQRLFGKRRTRVEVIHRETTKLRLNEFRQSSTLVSQASKLLASPDLRLMLEVLRNEHPGNEVYPLDAPLHLRAAHQARCEGYTMALSNLEALAEVSVPEEPLRPTFEPDKDLE